MAHLSIGGHQNPPPVEWVELTLMEKFGWTPAQLRAIPLGDVLRWYTMWSAQEKARV